MARIETTEVAPRLAGADLIALLSAPKSVAVVGASADPNAYGGRPVRSMQRYGFAGSLTLVNPNRESVHGLPCISSIDAIEPGSVDVAMVTVPAAATPEAVAALAAAGVRVTIAVAAAIEDSRKAEMLAAAEGANMRLIGPNCIGVIANRSATFLSFSSLAARDQPRQGSIALVTQSGAMGNVLLASIHRRGAGISHWISTGDELDVGSLELIAGLLRQDTVQAVGVFFEGMGDIEWLPEVERAIAETGKHVFVVKGAKTAAGRTAAAGHTGRIVGSAEASLEVMRAAGIVDVPDMTTLADVLIALDVAGRPRGRRVGIVSVSGGAGVLAADDIVIRANLELADLSDADDELAQRIGGRVHSVENPLDVAGSPIEIYADWVNTVATRPSCDAVLAITAPMMHDIEALVRELSSYDRRTMPLVLASFSEGDPLPSEAIISLAEAGIPVLGTPDRAVAALDALCASLQVERDGPKDAHHEDPAVLGLEAATRLLGPDLPWANHAVAATAAEARLAAVELGFPLVVKVAGRVVQHRSESGGVVIGVTEDELDEVFARVAAVAEAAGDAVLLQRQAETGSEMMVSCLRDRELGAIAYVRPGGVLTELIGGTAILWHGWSRERRRAHLRESIVGTLLDGYRGGKTYDLEALAEIVDALLEAVDSGQVDFIELNPVILGERGATLVDALVRTSVE